jgi:hypothetical protein
MTTLSPTPPTAPVPTLDAVRLVLEALRNLHRMSKRPMKSWDSGSVIDAQRVEEITEEAIAAWEARVPLAEDMRLKRELFRQVASVVAGFTDPQPGDYATEVLIALDAKLGERRG